MTSEHCQQIPDDVTIFRHLAVESTFLYSLHHGSTKRGISLFWHEGAEVGHVTSNFLIPAYWCCSHRRNNGFPCSSLLVLESPEKQGISLFQFIGGGVSRETANNSGVGKDACKTRRGTDERRRTTGQTN